MTAFNAVYDTEGGPAQFQKNILEYASLDYDWRFIKTGTIKLANSRYLSRFEPKPAVYRHGDRCNDPLIKRTDRAGGYSMSSRSASMQP